MDGPEARDATGAMVVHALARANSNEYKHRREETNKIFVVLRVYCS